MTKRSFLYAEIAAELRARIAKGLLAPDSRLPSLSELVDEFGVSAITIRRALGDLMHEGLIEGHQGLGVFVKPKPKIHRVLAGDPTSTIGDEIARAGFKPRLLEIGFSQIPAPDDIARRLGIKPGSSVYRHQKVTFADDDPVALHTLFMRPKLARELQDQLGRLFIFKLLDERNLPIASLKCEFSTVPLSEEQARILQIQSGLPMMKVDYTHLDRNASPLLVGQTICKADRFIFEVNLLRSSKTSKHR